MKLNLIMPMGGGGTRFGKQGFSVPKPLIEIYGKPFFYWATQSVAKFVDLQSLTFVVLKEHIAQFSIDEKILEFYPNAKITVIPEVLPGAVLTCMEGIKKVADGEPILFNDCDHLFLCHDFYDFCKNGRFSEVDGALLTFKSSDPRFSFAECGNDGLVKRTVEKQSVSDNAICGAYYFKDKRTFSEAVEVYLKNCQYKEFFVSGVYNVLANAGKKISIFGTDHHVSFGTPEEFEKAKGDLAWERLQ
ncbi:MAG: glycosyltransferase family 2 protein [Treponema sp.]|nr:glycosyltransferase family 2 protein [Treponema sp.]